MKNTFHKKLVVFCLSAVMSLGLCFGVAGLSPVGAASSAQFDVTAIETSYAIDTVVTVSNTADPANVVFPKEIDISSDVKATVNTIKYPDGYERSVGDSFVLNQLGDYIITYKTDAGLYYFDTFRVLDKFTNIVGDGTVEAFEKDGKIKGVTANMLPGTRTSFNKVIDLTQIDPETGCVDLFSAIFNVRDKATGYVPAKYVIMTLEDVNDPSVYLDIRMMVTNIGYFRVENKDIPDSGLLPSSAASETLTGRNKSLVCYINGVRYKNYFANGGRWWIDYGVDHIIRYNPETQQLFRDNNAKTHSDSNIFADLDNLDAYGPGIKFFTGFPSNAVKLTLSATDQVDTFSLDLTQIGDSKGEDLYNLIENGVDDVKAPQITINAKETSAGSVYAKLNSDFVIPTATAVDANNASPVSVKVFKNYVETSKVYVPLQADGTLRLNEKTVYTIEYTSFDNYGNLAKELLKVVPTEVTPITGYDIINDSNIQFGANKMALVAGEVCNANIYEKFATINDSDALKLNVDVTHAGKSVFNKEYSAKEIKEGNLKFDFLPVSIGDYVVTYNYSDNIEKGSCTYTVTCTSNNVINYKEAPLLHRSYIYGMKYDVSSHVAYQFGETLTAQNTTVEISYDDGATWTQVGNTFVVGADSNGEVPVTQSVNSIKFKYSCGELVQITDSAPVVDVRLDTTRPLALVTSGKGEDKVTGNLDYTKYFNLDEFDVTANAQYKYIFDAKASTGSASLKTNNPLTFDKKGELYTAITTYTELNSFTKLTISLVDAYDPTNTLDVFIELVQGETLIYLEGTKKYCLPDYPLFSTTPDKNTSSIEYTFSHSNQLLNISGKQFSTDFHPTNNLFYVDYTMSGICGTNAAISLTDISNVALTSRTVVDNKAPVFNFVSSTGTYALGTKLTVYAPVVTDFVTPYINDNAHTSVKVTVNNKAITSVDGITLDGSQPVKDYVIEISDVLIYKVTYTIVDDAGKSDNISYTIQGADKINPVITLGYDFNEFTVHNVTLGKPFTIDYTVSDDISETEAIYGRVIIVNDRTSRMIYAAEPMEYAESSLDYTLITDTCTITVKGMYTVYVYARDEASNTVYASYKLNVQ